MSWSWRKPHYFSPSIRQKKKKNRTKGEIPVARQEFTCWPSLCTRSEGSWHSRPHRLWCPISSRLFLTLQSIRPDADPHPELPRLAVSPDWPSWWDNDSAVCLALRIGLQGKSWKDLLPNITTICLTWTRAAYWGVNGFYLVTLIIRTVWSLAPRRTLWDFLLLHCGTRRLLDLAWTQKNEEFSTRNTSSLARLLLWNLMESFFNRAAFLPHIWDDWRQGKKFLWEMGVFSQANRNLKGDLIRVAVRLVNEAMNSQTPGDVGEGTEPLRVSLSSSISLDFWVAQWDNGYQVLRNSKVPVHM